MVVIVGSAMFFNFQVIFRPPNLTSCSFVVSRPLSATLMHSISFESPYKFWNIISIQEPWSTFKVWYLHLKYPYLCSAYLVAVHLRRAAAVCNHNHIGLFLDTNLWFSFRNVQIKVHSVCRKPFLKPWNVL